MKHSEHSANVAIAATIAQTAPRIGATFHKPAPVRPRPAGFVRRILRALKLAR